MTVCEEACKALRSQSKGKYQRAILYVSGEALRVVDEINKGLILDQTIEKVSFCAPDPHNLKGFSYICRDGTSRRWMCHGFMAVKDSGERLSHAVGVAFTVCLEKKQEREKEAVSVAFNDKGTSFTRTGSFRQATLTERLEDPQSAIVAEPVPQKQIFNPYAVQRPHAKDAMLERQGSFRGFTKLAESSPFKRQLSLRLNELPSTLDRQKQVLNQQSSVDNGFSPIPEASPSKEDVDSIAALCQEVSQGLNALGGPKPNNNMQNFQHTSSIPAAEKGLQNNNPWATSSSVAESWLASSATVAASPFAPPPPPPQGASPSFNPASRAPHLAEVRSHSLDSTQRNGSTAAWSATPQATTFDPFDAAWAASGRPSSTNPFQTPDNVTTAFKVNL
ncbi:hypothetical protein CAPTEDRAFT_228321 [Capitella teleta]|uniref:PID domain-containing protein n=1 Tax=Capitella teleta TaxID=283909 RepID=R7UWD3_CAPTE|nr:hypothetical protein CAPTEDRAFT_228321 [Capitella teleta]|eukprot:ELU10629.1 hypothetical protein CAPTEDRAFT_228321 [Capitella teleta]